MRGILSPFRDTTPRLAAPAQQPQRGRRSELASSGTSEALPGRGRREPRWARWGLASFCFFLAKGLLWLALAAAAAFDW